MAAYPPLRPDSFETTFPSVDLERAHRKSRCALAYRLFGAMGWGEQGDGHITARDPERDDCFWLLAFGVPFTRATVGDLVLVGPDGAVVDDDREINITAYNIHWPIHEARPDVVCAAHTHTAYGTPWSANAELFQPICQEATAFFENHGLFDDEDVQVSTIDGGKRIASALGEHRGVILRNHGLLTVGASVDEAMGWYIMMERVAEVHVKAHRAKPISAAAARAAAREIGDPLQGWQAFNWAIRNRIPDPTVVD